MKITFLHILVFCTLMTVSLVIGYLADDLFNRQWYGYLLMGAAVSCFLYFNTLKTPVYSMAMHPYVRLGLLLFTVLLLLSAIGFLGHILLGIDFYQPLFFGIVITFGLNYKNVKSKIKKQ